MLKMEAKNTKCTSNPKVTYSSISRGANLSPRETGKREQN